MLEATSIELYQKAAKSLQLDGELVWGESQNPVLDNHTACKLRTQYVALMGAYVEMINLLNFLQSEKRENDHE